MASDPPIVPKPPFRPKDHECCNRGCEPCILDYYDIALERWEARILALGLDPQALLAQAETERASPLTPSP